jgi:outer membrane receptor protein involved in Fe transport
VAFAIGRQGGVSIAFRDSSLMRRPALAIRGQMEPAAALARLAKSSGLQLKKIGPNSYLLLAAAPRAKPPAAKPRLRLASAPAPDPAEEEAPPQEIIVTASKRDTPSPRFAGQWTRIDGDVFAPLGIAGAEAIEARTVGFSSTHLGAGRNKLFIRGIADSSFSGPTQSPVGQYFGDMRTGYSGPDPDLKLVDMQSIEVLEGPQGTLYGSGALGGIVLLKPNMPVLNELKGSAATGASVTWHGDPGYDLSGVLNAPVTNGSALRLVAYRAREGGYVDNIATGEHDINDVEVTGGRATFTAEVRPGWFVDIAGIGQKIDGDDSQYADREGDDLSRDSLVDQPFSSDFALGAFVVRKDSGSIRFRSTTGISRQDVRENFDASIGDEQSGQHRQPRSIGNGSLISPPQAMFGDLRLDAAGDRIRQLRQHSRARAISNETRVWRPMKNGYGWLVGFSSIGHRYRVSRTIAEDGVEADLSGTENKVRETTFFGEFAAELAPKIEASIGARYTRTSLKGTGSHLTPLAMVRLAEEDAKRTENRFLPSAALLARPIDKLTVYLRYQQGFRPGGLSIANDVVRLYRNDRLGTAEAGFRYGRADRDPFDVQGSVTLSRWSDIQADFLDGSGLPVTDNIGDGRVWTVSLNGGAQLTSDLRIEAGFAWNDGKITRPTTEYLLIVAEAADAKGGGDSMRIPNIARIVARGSIDWRRDIGGGRTFEANAYARYVGRSRLGVGPHLGQEQGDYVDSGMVLRLADDRKAVSLSVTNLTDEIGNRFAFGAPVATSADQITPLRPRTVRLGFELAF